MSYATGLSNQSVAIGFQPMDYHKHSLLMALKQSPGEFEFFQAVRLIHKAAHEAALYPIGHGVDPKQEALRFHSLAALDFPVNDICELRHNSQGQLTMVVSFLGLTGPSGVLPDHYTELLIQRLYAKDSGLHDFLDLFNHRLLSLFYRSWEKNRFYIGYEQAALRKQRDAFSQMIASLIGLGTPYLRERLAVADEALLHYAGFFARLPRSAVMLESMLQGYFKLAIKVEQFQGAWLQLAEHESSRLPSSLNPNGNYAQLGINTMLGRRVWDVQHRFRLTLGPLNYHQFNESLPSGKLLKPLVELTRFYVGTHLSFTIQLCLKAEDVPYCSLAKNSPRRLGWNTWLKNRPFQQAAEDAIITKFV